MLYNPRLLAPAAAVARKADVRIARVVDRILLARPSVFPCASGHCGRYRPCFERACKTGPAHATLSTTGMRRAGRAAPLRGIGETSFSCNPSILDGQSIQP